jgi:hypothetical protein
MIAKNAKIKNPKSFTAEGAESAEAGRVFNY